MTANHELAIVPKQVSIAAPSIPTTGEIEALNAMCKIAAYSGFLNSTSTDPTRRAADAFFVMMYGRELGIPAMTSLKTIYVIDGKPSCSGQALLSLIRRGGVDVDIPNPGEITDKAVVKFKRPGGVWKSYTYTKDMATAAGLWNSKQNWKKFPAEMLIWRAVSTAARFETPDIVGGLYTIEELQPDRAVNEQGDPLDNIGFTGTVTEAPPISIEPEAPEAPAVEVNVPVEQPAASKATTWQWSENTVTDLMFETREWTQTGAERMNTINSLQTANAFKDCASLNDAIAVLKAQLESPEHGKAKKKVTLDMPPDDEPETEPAS